MKPTSDPIARAAMSPVRITCVPCDGSSRSRGSRLSRKTVPENFDSRTCGNNRSISQASSSSVALMLKSFVR